ncbi:hypothetical protein PI125_g26003 [Phytophthora idaei]|nr:hypothetical protein PI125_g26003 [Phytophthora idaei]
MIECPSAPDMRGRLLDAVTLFVAELALITTAADNIAASEWSDTGRDNTCVHSDSGVPPPHPSAAWRVPTSPHLAVFRACLER